MSALTTNFIAQPALSEWGWRIPFLIGAILSLYGLYIRIGLPETPHFVAVEQQRAVESRPMLRALKDHPRESFVVFALQMGTVMFYIWTVFLPTYAHLAGGLPLSQGLIGGVISLAVFCVVTPAAGALSDRIGRRPLLIAYAVGFFVLAWPMLHLLQNGDFMTFLLVDIVGCVLLAMIDGVLSATLCELFPTAVRTSGIGLPYAVCAAIFGGTAPLIAAWLISINQARSDCGVYHGNRRHWWNHVCQDAGDAGRFASLNAIKCADSCQESEQHAWEISNCTATHGRCFDWCMTGPAPTASTLHSVQEGATRPILHDRAKRT